jgi:hypothetical protein
MKIDEVAVGVRVRLICNICGGSYPGATIAEIMAGETAEIIEFEPDADVESGEAPVRVRFDNHLETLDDWLNQLGVGIDRDLFDWDTTIEDWEVVRGFY